MKQMGAMNVSTFIKISESKDLKKCHLLAMWC